jgi:LacI family transcriptional regulator
MGHRPHVALLIETSLASGRDILRGIARYLREHNPWSLYHEAHGLADSIPSWLSHWTGDGIIARVQSPQMAEEIRAVGVPVVDVLGAIELGSFPLVHVNNRTIGRMAAEHLLDRGLNSFGYFGLPDERWSRERYDEFRHTVALRDGTVDRYALPRDALDTLSWQDVIEGVAEWVERLPKPAGIFVGSDQQGPLMLEACRRAAFVVPDEVAVVSVDNDDPLCEVCDPPLSSIDARHEAVGYLAAGLLDSMLRGTRTPKIPPLVEPEHVVARRSSDTFAVGDPALANALMLIRDRAHEGLSVDEIARHVGLSRSVLQRRFRTSFKRTVHDEILRAKIKLAKDLLIKSRLPLATVAVRSGFKHQEYLGSVLKKRLGKTPREIRANARVK